MASSCIDPSSVLEKQNICLNQQKQQQLMMHNQSANYIGANLMSPFPPFKSPINDQESSSNIAHVHGQVYNPIKMSLVNGWPDFCLVDNPDAAREMDKNYQITENIKKRKGENDASLKAENSINMEEGSSSSKKAKQVISTNNSEERNANAKEGSQNRKGKGKSKKEQSSELSSEENRKDASGSTVTAKPDYIHVRARRGQATDSHSLAERVRREKISERMRYLQELVPGCNKVTGKAGMLDEIINYVQSLQRQVEFLSMKLAAVNPTVDFDIDDFINRQMIIPTNAACLPMINVLNSQLDPALLQFNPLQRPACYGLEMPMDNPNPGFTGSIPEPVSASHVTLGDQYINVNLGSSNWDIGPQNLYCQDPQQARALGFPF